MLPSWIPIRLYDWFICTSYYIILKSDWLCRIVPQYTTTFFPKKVSIAWYLVAPSFFLKGYEVLSKYVALYAANVIKDGNTLKALDLFCKYGAPANPQVNLTFSLTYDTCYLFDDIIEITLSHQYFLFALYLSAFFCIDIARRRHILITWLIAVLVHRILTFTSGSLWTLYQCQGLGLLTVIAHGQTSEMCCLKL